MMGGVKTDINGATNIKGLYAAGEAACTGVHGANRLASNSLLEGLVYGYRAGRASVEFGVKSSELRGKRDLKALNSKLITLNSHGFDMEEARTSLRRLMWEKVGIIRCGESLGAAKEKLSEWRQMLGMDFGTRRGLELKNMLTVALLITESALARKGSVGAHYRSDFKERGENWQRHIRVKNDDIRPYLWHLQGNR
jgi:L-aspartate oxidase